MVVCEVVVVRVFVVVELCRKRSLFSKLGHAEGKLERINPVRYAPYPTWCWRIETLCLKFPTLSSKIPMLLSSADMSEDEK